jgi:hypothetical protein
MESAAFDLSTDTKKCQGMKIDVVGPDEGFEILVGQEDDEVAAVDQASLMLCWKIFQVVVPFYSSSTTINFPTASKDPNYLTLNPKQMATYLTVQAFSDLMHDEYHISLDDFLKNNELDEEEVIGKVGRLVGVLLKEPFANPTTIDPSQSFTGAYRAWNIKPEFSSAYGTFEEEKLRTDKKLVDHWQYQVLNSIRKEMELDSVETLVNDAVYERGFFSFLSRSISKYICGNKELEKAIAKAKKETGQHLRLTPTTLLGAGGTTLAAALIKAVPWLSAASAPIITGLVIIIGTIGIDAYCSWVGQQKDTTINEQ